MDGEARLRPLGYGGFRPGLLLAAGPFGFAPFGPPRRAQGLRQGKPVAARLRPARRDYGGFALGP